MGQHQISSAVFQDSTNNYSSKVPSLALLPLFCLCVISQNFFPKHVQQLQLHLSSQLQMEDGTKPSWWVSLSLLVWGASWNIHSVLSNPQLASMMFHRGPQYTHAMDGEDYWCIQGRPGRSGIHGHQAKGREGCHLTDQICLMNRFVWALQPRVQQWWSQSPSSNT